MNKLYRRFALGLGILASSVTLAPSAFAGCGDRPLKHKTAWRAEPGGESGLFQLASYEQQASIVGMWRFKMVSAGVETDYGYSLWHGDGTEFSNSGARAPATQNYCLGIYKQTGSYSYQLSHWALSFDLGGHPNGNVNIRQSVTLDPSGNSYSGNFTLNAYDITTGALLFPPLTGQVTADRVNLDD